MTHWTWLMLALRLVCRAGMATLTTEPSMKAMAEPRMVATRTQVPAAVEGSLNLPERRRASSQVDLPRLDICFALRGRVFFGEPANVGCGGGL